MAKKFAGLPRAAKIVGTQATKAPRSYESHPGGMKSKNIGMTKRADMKMALKGTR